MNKEQKAYELAKLKLERLHNYPEVIAVLNDFMDEIAKQVGEFERELSGVEIGDAMYEVMEDHGWVDEGEESKKEIQDIVNKAIK